MDQLVQLEPEHPGPVELRVPANPRQLPLIRAAVESMALLCDFDLDDAADIKLAADELCSILISNAASGALLTCTFTVEANRFRLRATTHVNRPNPVDPTTFSWQILQTLATSVTVSQPSHHSTDGYFTVIELVKEGGNHS